MIMDARRENLKNIKKENGQALIEFLLFLPFMLMMYSLISSVSNSLNASINQQKITRGYFYFRHQNNSMLPKPRRLGGGEASDDWSSFGMQIMGWTEKLLGDQPLAPCFKFRAGLGTNEDDECEQAFSNQSTQFIRVGTVYGICGATFLNQDGRKIRLPASESPAGAFTQDSCLIQ